MTIFRVNTMRDKAQVVKALPKVAETDKAVIDAIVEMSNLQMEMADLISGKSKKLLASARAVYTKSDKAMKELQKDKKANKEELAEMTEIRKHAYHLGTMLKKNYFLP